MSYPKPDINVTPLIDVLLVLLIIFMVISPGKPTDFKARIPQEPKAGGKTNPQTLVVGLNHDSSLSLNRQDNIATMDEPDKLIQALAEIFRKRTENRAYSQNAEFRNDLSEEEKTVFIKAPRSIGYGKVVKIIDAVKIAGASPISLQINDLN